MEQIEIGDIDERIAIIDKLAAQLWAEVHTDAIDELHDIKFEERA